MQCRQVQTANTANKGDGYLNELHLMGNCVQRGINKWKTSTWEGRSNIELTVSGGLRRTRYELDCSDIWGEEEESQSFYVIVDFRQCQHFLQHYAVNTNKFQPFSASNPLDRQLPNTCTVSQPSHLWHPQQRSGHAASRQYTILLLHVAVMQIRKCTVTFKIIKPVSLPFPVESFCV